MHLTLPNLVHRGGLSEEKLTLAGVKTARQS